MRTRDFNPLNDLLFKYVFGHEERKDITIAFLNAVLNLENEKAIADIRFENRLQEPEIIDGKLSILDILCIIGDGTQINIEVQVVNYHNMDKRTLYYWAKLYEGSIKSGDDYSLLKRTVTINLLNFTMLPQEDFHSVYSVYDAKHAHRLNDDLEIHFLELPKFQEKNLV